MAKSYSIVGTYHILFICASVFVWTYIFISPMYIPMSRIAELCNSVYLFEQLPNFQNLGFCDVPVALGKTAQWVFCVPETV